MIATSTTRSCACNSPTYSPTACDLQTGVLQAITGLTQLLTQLASHLPQPERSSAESWPEQPQSIAAAAGAPANRSALWDELSVVELRSLLRSYPIDRTSLPAPIELLRRGELMEALSQLQSLGA